MKGEFQVLRVTIWEEIDAICLNRRTRGRGSLVGLSRIPFRNRLRLRWLSDIQGNCEVDIGFINLDALFRF